MAQMLNRLGIAAKLMVAPVIVALLLLAFGLFSHFNLLSTQGGLEDLLSGAVARERSAQETEVAINATHAAAYRSLALLNLKSDKARESAEALMADEPIKLLAGDAGPFAREEIGHSRAKAFVRDIVGRPRLHRLIATRQLVAALCPGFHPR